MSDKKSIFAVLSVIGVSLVLSITIFLVSKPQDIRQNASSTLNELTPTDDLPGCPPGNSDGSTNTCRAQADCRAAEIEKENGKSDCTQRLGKLAICCTLISPK